MSFNSPSGWILKQAKRAAALRKQREEYRETKSDPIYKAEHNERKAKALKSRYHSDPAYAEKCRVRALKRYHAKKIK